MTAPPVIAVETPSTSATPTRPTPMVPAVVQELPMLMAIPPQISAVAA
nr:hypothetical protein [Streptomyces flavochromogenes]